MTGRAERVGLGAALRRAWVAYRRRLNEELAAAGYFDQGFPDGRVLRFCAQSGAVTISQIGRELGVTRQAASKIVASLHDRKFVRLAVSPSDGREKVVTLTPAATEFLEAHRRAARKVERELRNEVGDEAFESLLDVLGALGGEDQPRLRDYLRTARASDLRGDLEL